MCNINDAQTLGGQGGRKGFFLPRTERDEPRSAASLVRSARNLIKSCANCPPTYTTVHILDIMF